MIVVENAPSISLLAFGAIALFELIIYLINLMIYCLNHKKRLPTKPGLVSIKYKGSITYRNSYKMSLSTRHM